ncbi:DoxX family membrane protein [Candidatus Nomurabacteria bacterium]|nr:DoxX family membrane protein [Candidatus Nomurabacteria bacterium]
MNKTQKISLFLLRVGLGLFFFYAGFSKIIDSSWSAAGYISSAKHFVGFYGALLSPSILPIVNFLNAWGLTLLGLSLLTGIFVRLSSILGIVLMALYYLALPFPHPDAHSFIIDDHIILILALLVVINFGAGKIWSLTRRA